MTLAGRPGRRQRYRPMRAVVVGLVSAILSASASVVLAAVTPSLVVLAAVTPASAAPATVLSAAQPRTVLPDTVAQGDLVIGTSTPGATVRYAGRTATSSRS